MLNAVQNGPATPSTPGHSKRHIPLIAAYAFPCLVCLHRLLPSPILSKRSRLEVANASLRAPPTLAVQQLAEPDSPTSYALCYATQNAFDVSVLQSMGSQVSSKGLPRFLLRIYLKRGNRMSYPHIIKRDFHAFKHIELSLQFTTLHFMGMCCSR